MSRAAITVASTTREVASPGLNVTLVANGYARCTCGFLATSISGYIPTMDDEIIVSMSTDKLFGGPLNALPLTGMGGEPGLPVRTDVSANDFSIFAERRFLNEVIPAGTTKAALVIVVAALADLGVTLDSGQLDGPSLPEIPLTWVKIKDFLDQLSLLAGGVWVIDPDKKLRMRFSGESYPCPFNVVDGDGHAIGDVKADPTRNQFYANQVIGVIPPTDEKGFTDNFVGDGVTTTFPLTLIARDEADFRGVVLINGGAGPVYETLGTAPATWLWDLTATPVTIHDTGLVGGVPITYRASPPAVGVPISIVYDGVNLGVYTATDAGEVALRKLWQTVIQLSPDDTPATAQAKVDAELARRKVLQKQVTYLTYQTGARPGMTQTITQAARGVSGTFLIQEVNITDQGLASGDLLYKITAIETNLFQTTWRDTIKQWAATGTTGVSSAPAVSGGAAPGGNFRDVQFNDGGVFGGIDTVLLDKDGTGQLYGVDTLPAVFAIGAGVTAGETLIYEEKFAFGQSNTSMHTNGTVYNVYPPTNSSQDANYPFLKYTENVKAVAGVGPAGENVIEPWQVAGSPNASDSALLFDGFGPLSDTRFDGSYVQMWVDYYLDGTQMNNASGFSPIIQYYGVTSGNFPQTGTGAGQYPNYGSGDVYLAIYQTSGDTWTAELKYNRASASTDAVVLTTYTFSKTAVENAWHRFKIIFKAATVLDWSKIALSNNTAAVGTDGWLKAYFDDTLMYDITTEQIYLTTWGTAVEANRGQAVALGFHSLAGWVTNLHIGIPSSTATQQFALWNTTAGIANAFTGVVDENGIARFKSPQDIVVYTPKAFEFTGNGFILSQLDWATNFEPVGAIFAIYSSVAPTGSGTLNYIDIEPGFDAGGVGQTIPVGGNFTGIYTSPFAKTAASGTHDKWYNVQLDPGQATLGGATVNTAINLFVNGAPGDGTFAVLNYALFVQGAASRFDAAVVLTEVLFADLPGSPETGTIMSVSNSNTAVWGATVGGGGGNHILARWNGSNWTVVGI